MTGATVVASVLGFYGFVWAILIAGAVGICLGSWATRSLDRLRMERRIAEREREALRRLTELRYQDPERWRL